MTSQKLTKKGRITDAERVGVRRRFCKDCREATIHETGSQLWVSCRLQSGWRSINAVCNLSEIPKKKEAS